MLSWLYRILTNPFYAGVLEQEERTYFGKHTPMVTKEEFASVQAVISGRNRSVPHRKDRPEFPLRGFARCDAGLHPVTGAFSRGRGGRYPYYVCQRAHCPKSSPFRTVRAARRDGR